MIELIAGMSAATLLAGGLATSLYVATRASTPSRVEDEHEAGQVLEQMLRDVKCATSFSERTTTAITFTVPDRDGDGQQEVIRYAWSGTKGDPLTYAYNGSADVVLAEDVHRFNLGALTRDMEGSGVSPPDEGGSRLLFIVADPAALNASETSRLSLIESWGYAVTLLDDGAAAAEYESELLGSDVAYVSPSVSSTLVSNKLSSTTVGVVNEPSGTLTALGFSTGSGAATGDSLTVAQGDHYILSEFGASIVQVATSGVSLTAPSGTLASGLETLAEIDSRPALAVLEAGASLSGATGFAAGRRAHLPYAAVSAGSLTADGQLMMRRTIAWAAGAGETNNPLKLLIATASDVNAGGAPTLDAWTKGEALNIGGDAFALEPNGATNGTFSSLLNLNTFAADGSATIDAIHYVGSSISVGGISLAAGDLLLSTKDDETFTSSNILAVSRRDVFVFKPSAPGDYSDGEFVYLLDSSGISGEEIVAVSLVEKTTTVGDGVLEKGSFLLAFAGRRDVLKFIPSTVGAGSTSGVLSDLIGGSAFGFGSEVRGLDVFESPTLYAATTYPEGTLLVTLSKDDSDGFADLNSPVDSSDIVMLKMNVVGASPTGHAEILFDGGDVDLTTDEEHINALSFVHTVEASNGGGGEEGGGSGGGSVQLASVATGELENKGRSITVDRPSGVGENDLLIAVVATDNNNSTSLAAPTGWTVIDISSEASQVTLGVWWKLASAAEPSDYIFNWNTKAEAFAFITRITGHNTSAPIQASATSGGNSSLAASPSVTTSADNTLILRFGAFDDDDITAGQTGINDHTTIVMERSSEGTNTVSAGGAFLLQPTAGASGSRNFALTATEQYRTVTLAIAPNGSGD